MSATIVLDPQGNPVSIGTVVAVPLPAGYTTVTITDADFDAIRAGEKVAGLNGALTSTGRAAQTANAATLAQRAQAALTANDNFLAIASPTQAQTLAQVKVLSKECNALIRLALNLLDDITDTA